MEHIPEENKKLSQTDIKELISESEQFKKLPSIDIGIAKIDIQSTYITILALITWFLIWYCFNIFSIVPYADAFFIFYIVILLINLFNSANDIPDVDSERVNIASQQNFIQGGLAVFILAFVFLYNIKMDENYRINVYKILIICLIVTSLGIIIINLKNNSKNIRMVRKIQQFLYNQGLILFILSLFVIYIYKSRNILGENNTNV